MLVLSRRAGEIICIGENIRITVLNVAGDQARLGIDAPIDIKVHRHEVYQRIQEQKNGDASDGTPHDGAGEGTESRFKRSRSAYCSS